MNSITLSDLVDEYLAAMKANGYAPNTVRSATRTLRAFLLQVGNVQARHVQAKHVDSYFAHRLASGVASSTLNVELVWIRQMFKHARVRRHVVASADPTAHRRRLREAQKPKRRLAATEFARLLDAATHPRDRIVIALGIYLLLRQSEIKALRVDDVNLQLGTISAKIIKSSKLDDMPISSELDRELRRWLTWYGQEAGPLQPSWFLVPAKSRPLLIGPSVQESHIMPTKSIGQPERVIHRALVALGYELRDADGKATHDGVHTLRRSAARAVFDRLSDDGYDGAGRIVQALLHHSSFSVTELYLGIELDQKRRDDMIRGKEMFPVSTENVVGFKVAHG